MYRFINRNQLIVSGIVLCCLSTYGSAQKNHPRVIDGTFGPVRSIEEWKVSSWSAGGKKRAKRTLSSRELYDRSGKLTAYTTYKDDGEVLFGDRNTYDASGRLVGTQTIHSQFVYLPDKQIYVYDDRGNLVETKGFDSTGTHLGGHLYSYDSADNLVEEMVYPIGVNLVYSNHHLTRHVYDKKGNEIGRQQYDTRAGDITPNEFGMGYQRRVFLNDNAGRPVLIGYLKADNTIGRIETVEYDSRGNTIQEPSVRPQDAYSVE